MNTEANPNLSTGYAEWSSPEALIDLLYEAATEIANLDATNNPVRMRLIAMAKELEARS